MTLYCQRAGKYFDSWEIARDSERNKFISDSLDQYIRYSRELDFYHERLKSYEKNSRFPLEKVPVLESKEFRQGVPPQGEEHVLDKGRHYSVFQSGGTTGAPKTTLFSHEELEQLNLPNARGFFAVGLKDTDRVANLWAVGNLYMTFIHINRMLQQYGCMNFPFSHMADPAFVHNVVRQFEINCITGVASFVLQMTRLFEKFGLDGIRVEKVYFGAEHFFEADKKEIREKLGAKIIAAPGYGSIDTWYLGYQCLECPTGVFHAHDDQVYLEMVDEENQRACDREQVGMLYATPFLRRITPIVRYRVGDRAKWLLDNCSCGRTTPLFRLLGRGDDVLRIGCDSVDYNSLQMSISRVKGLSGTAQMEKRRLEGKDLLILRVETDLPESDKKTVAAILREDFLKARPLLMGLFENGNIWPVQIELLPPGSLPKNTKTGKLIRVIDTMDGK